MFRMQHLLSHIFSACLVVAGVLAMMKPDGYSFRAEFIAVALVYGFHLFCRGMFFCRIADRQVSETEESDHAEGGKTND